MVGVGCSWEMGALSCPITSSDPASCLVGGTGRRSAPPHTRHEVAPATRPHVGPPLRDPRCLRRPLSASLTDTVDQPSDT